MKRPGGRLQVAETGPMPKLLGKGIAFYKHPFWNS